MSATAVIIIIAAGALAWLGVAAVIRVAARVRLVDRAHEGRGGGPAFRQLPRLGGIGIAGGALAAAALAVVGGEVALGGGVLALGALVLVVGAVGVVDDVARLHGSTKLIILIAAGSGAWLAGWRIEILPGTGVALPLPVAAAVTVAWMTVVPTAVNIVDGLDGLASGLVMIACATLALAGLLVGDHTTTMLALIALAATFGFWLHNRHPARIFMGDGGAMFLGFLLAALAARVLDAAVATPVPAVLVLGGLAWPLGELASTVWRRLGGGLMRADAGHIHHRLHARLGHAAAVRRIHGLALVPLAALGVLGVAGRVELGPREVSAEVSPTLAQGEAAAGAGSPVSESHLP